MSLIRLILLIAIVTKIGHCDEHEYRLMKYLMNGYDAGVRPAKNASQPMVVVFGLSLHHIIDVDEKNQILTTNCWITQIWTDHHLMWNISEFAGIRVLRIPYSRIWLPDTILYNNADPQYSSAVINTNVIVSHTGQVIWLSHGVYRSTCNIEIEFFPFDEQRCALKWASWTYDGYQLELEAQSEAGDTSNYQVNGEFDLLDFSAQRNIEFYSCCPEPYPDITYEIRLRRRPMFYVFNLILPSLLVFYVPSESGEKVTLGISALLSMTVFLMTIRETLPPTEKTPLISLYYGVSICLVSFASGLAVVTLNLHHRGIRGTRVPTLIKSLILEKLARLIFFNFQDETPKDTNENYQEETTRRRQSCPLHFSMEMQQQQQQSSQKYIDRNSDNNSSSSNISSPSINLANSNNLEIHWLKILQRVHSTIEKNEKRLVEQDNRQRSELEWKQVALVSDRALLCIFFLTTAISTAIILSGSPPVDPIVPKG
ncbi:neuronal acetylcholine receptor subunit alpha-10-like isoform X2 [Aphidius gifuensis]|uniref:neuronal acetylcholine receptor subunit alpha-10-like isoform X2 n=1 Tax=Aphidius gifuensis TaxID=684658 RepID=UPI001CDB9955|nr:neuronal acetylcholine receptor subunit alpha-10-like isoform X2 [Aphidius gifuensis]